MEILARDDMSRQRADLFGYDLLYPVSHAAQINTPSRQRGIMSKKSATDKIKGLNPKNISGTIPQALDLIQQLKKSQGNPPMVDAVGLQNLLGMLQFVAQKFSQNQVPNRLTLDQILASMNITSLQIARADFMQLAKEILGVFNLRDVFTTDMDMLDRIGELLVNNRDIRNLISNVDEIVETVLENVRNMR